MVDISYVNSMNDLRYYFDESLGVRASDTLMNIIDEEIAFVKDESDFEAFKTYEEQTEREREHYINVFRDLVLELNALKDNVSAKRTNKKAAIDNIENMINICLAEY